MTPDEASVPAGVVRDLVAALRRRDENAVLELLTQQFAGIAFSGGTASTVVLQTLGVEPAEFEALEGPVEVLRLSDGSVGVPLLRPGTAAAREEDRPVVNVRLIQRSGIWRVAGRMTTGDVVERIQTSPTQEPSEGS